MYCWFSFSAILFLFNMSVVFSYIVPPIVCVCVCVYVCKKWEVLEVDCKVRGASIRCGLEAGDGEAVLGWDGGFQYYQAKRNKNNYTPSVPLSDWTIMYFASMLANSVSSSILALRSGCTLNPCLQHHRLCFWSVYTRYIIKFIFDVPLYTWFTVFNICGLWYTSIVVNSNWSRRIL
jgi:hypothetical protein